MRDETADAAREAAKNGKLTWSVALDGKPGRIVTKWAVRGFPTVYVIDKDGMIAAGDKLNRDKLREEVARLVGEAE